MEIANLLKTYDSKTYYLNLLEKEAIEKFCQSSNWFMGYDEMIKRKSGTLQEVKECSPFWFSYVNRDMKSVNFSTNILAYISLDVEDFGFIRNSIELAEDISVRDFEEREEELQNRITLYYDDLSAKDIGDIGENLVHGHECMRVKLGGREDLIHLIKCIPAQFAIGYDINSVELDERKRFIEVKTTISSKPLHFNKIHLTNNEWNAARSMKDRYYVYRLLLSKHEIKLFLLPDPVGLYEQGLIDIVKEDGVDITFNPKRVGRFEDLLTWKK